MEGVLIDVEGSDGARRIDWKRATGKVEWQPIHFDPLSPPSAHTNAQFIMNHTGRQARGVPGVLTNSSAIERL